MRVDWRSVIAAIVTMSLANVLYGYPLPVNTNNAQQFVVSGVLFGAYLYLARSLFRLPLALRIGIKRFRHVREHYGLEFRAALIDGFYRGLMDQRSWSNPITTILERLIQVLTVWFACRPDAGPLLVQIGGILGLVLLILIYIIIGRYNLFGTEGLSERSLNELHIRRPNDLF